MTIKELKDKLEVFSDDLTVFLITPGQGRYQVSSTEIKNDQVYINIV